LISDQGFEGIVVRLKGEFCVYTFSEDIVKTGAGVLLGGLIQKCLERKLSGLEYLNGIPGTIGGALISNAGTTGHWIGDVVVDVDVLSDLGHVQTLKKEELRFYYRGSSLENRIILASTLCLKKAQKNDILNTINEIMNHRLKSQPLDEWNAGSIFKNPPGQSVGELIEKAGLKGLKFGGAKISEKHANFIVNVGDAKSSDVRSLIGMIKNKVKEMFNINLELEIKIIGE
jgi:UDP-N-acetylmuramate dehydrogenase